MAEQLALEWPGSPVGGRPRGPTRPGSGPAPDQRQRDRIVEDLTTTLFVEAGAGSGKTTALVDRIVALVARGVPMRSIAAITFTDKAATELRDRLRQRLERRADDDGDAGRFADALDDLDGAAIGTLHAFAQRLLSESPVEAGLPPAVEVLDEVTSGVEFERRWAAFRDALLGDTALERTILLLLAAGVRPDALRVLAVAFDANWDLVAERVPSAAPEPPSVKALLAEAGPVVDAVCAEVGRCRRPDDGLVVRLEDIAAYLADLRAKDDEIDLMEALSAKGRPTFRVKRAGSKGNWSGDLDELRARVGAAGEALEEIRHQVAQACAKRIATSIRRFTLAAADERRGAGRLEFHDLLVLARALVTDPVHGAAVRARLHERYERVLLDEFQDTDPIQIELAVRIAAADPAGDQAGTAPWGQVDVAAGHLFVVGDPKQSIYRFRRADIATFLAARDRFAGAGGAPVSLSANFRAGAPIIEWVNCCFEALMGEEPEVDVPVSSQAPYVALVAVRPAAPAGPSVSILGRDLHPRRLSADELRSAEAESVAAAVATAIEDGWSVDDGEGGWREARLGDIAVLVPARTSLPFLEDALGAAGIPFRAESSSLVYASRAVRDVLMVLRAVDDPTDHLRTIAALRTPLLACGDDDLFRFRVEQGGSWSYQREATGEPRGPVAEGLAYLRRLHDLRRWDSPSELLERIVVDRRAFELGFAEGRPRDVWRRLRFVIDQSRAWSDAIGGGLREYLHWVEQQSAEGARVAESVLPETDDDAVRIMTVHAAKGLEFPIAIVSGMSTVPGGVRASAQVVFPPAGDVGYSFGQHVHTDEFEAWRPIDEQMGYDERIRLLYVACTRARDHLVLSVHRKARKSDPPANTRTNAELLVSGMGGLMEDLPDATPDATDEGERRITSPSPHRPAPIGGFTEWAVERAAALSLASRPTTVAATALSEEGSPSEVIDDELAGLEKRPRDLDLAPWLKGRYGTAVGRAVHGALQTIDLATGEGLDAAVAAQCEAEAVPDRGAVARLVGDALTAPSVRAAAASAHWRELYACIPAGDGRLLEGYVDLLYRAPDGLVVVDYKTAATAHPAQLDRRLAGYRMQGASYAVAVGAATGEPVARVVFVFLTPEGAVERELPELEAAMAEVTRLVAAGGEVVVG